MTQNRREYGWRYTVENFLVYGAILAFCLWFWRSVIELMMRGVTE